MSKKTTMFEKKDKKMDKKMGIKENSKKDTAMDKKGMAKMAKAFKNYN